MQQPTTHQQNVYENWREHGFDDWTRIRVASSLQQLNKSTLLILICRLDNGYMSELELANLEFHTKSFLVEKLLGYLTDEQLTGKGKGKGKGKDKSGTVLEELEHDHNEPKCDMCGVGGILFLVESSRCLCRRCLETYMYSLDPDDDRHGHGNNDGNGNGNNDGGGNNNDNNNSGSSSDDEVEWITMRVEMPNGNIDTHGAMESTCPVEVLKDLVWASHFIPVASQKLSFHGIVMHNARSFKHYGVHEGDVVKLEMEEVDPPLTISPAMSLALQAWAPQLGGGSTGKGKGKGKGKDKSGKENGIEQ